MIRLNMKVILKKNLCRKRWAVSKKQGKKELIMEKNCEVAILNWAMSLYLLGQIVRNLKSENMFLLLRSGRPVV